MNRRSWFKALGLSAGGAAASAASGSVATASSTSSRETTHPRFDRAKHAARLELEVDEIIKFREAVLAFDPTWKVPEATAVPFGTHPATTTYARVSNEIRDVVARPNLKTGIWFSADLQNALWNRIRPGWMHLNKDNIEVAAMKAEYAKNRKRNVPSLLPDRISTPIFTVDEQEIDPYIQAALACSVYGLRDFYLQRHAECVERLQKSDAEIGIPFDEREGDGWVSPVKINTEYSFHVLKVSFSVIAAGMAYLSSDAKWLAERRKSPFHWHKLPLA